MREATITLTVRGRRTASTPRSDRVPLGSLPWTVERIFPLALFQVGWLLWFGAVWTIGCAIASAADSPAQPYFDFERTAPFVAWMVPCYVSQDLAVLLVPFAFRDVRDYLPLATVMLVLGIVASTCFALFPMTLGFEGGSGVWAPLAATVGAPDPGAGGYAPSLHVAYMVVIAAALAPRLGPRAAPWLWAWAAAVAASTYYVHEHHLVDIATGAVLGMAGAAVLPVASRWVSTIRPRSTSPAGDAR